MSSSKATFSYAQAAKGLSSSSTPTAKSTPSPAAAQDATSSSQHQATSSASIAPKDVESMSKKDSIDIDASQSPAAHHEKSHVNGVSTPESPDFGMSSMSTLVKEDDQSSAVPTSSESTWDNKSVASINASDKVDGSSDKSTLKEPTQTPFNTESKSLHEAPPPVVNIWKKRAEALASTTPTPSKAQAVPSFGGNNTRRHNATNDASDEKITISANEKKSSTSPSNRNQNDSRTPHGRRESRVEDDNSKSRKISASSRTTSREEKASNPPLPPDRDQEAWPTPELAEKDDKKKMQEKSDKPEKADKDDDDNHDKKKAHGKKEWVSMNYTPSVVFSTPLPGSGRRGGRGDRRTGRDGATRGGSAAGTGSSPQSDKASGPLSAMPGGDQQTRRGRSDAPARSTSPGKTRGTTNAESSSPDATQTVANGTSSVLTSSPTRTEALPNGHHHGSSTDRSVNGNGYGAMRGNGRSSRGRRGDFVGGPERRRETMENTPVQADSQSRGAARRESVAPSEDGSERRQKSISEDPFAQSKAQIFERRGGPYATYPNPRERMDGRTRGNVRARGGNHNFQPGGPMPNGPNGQSQIPPYGYPQSRSPPNWASEQQGPFYPPQHGQQSRAFRGGSSRAQSIPNDAAYGRFNPGYPGPPTQIPPLQTMLTSNMYDPHGAHALTSVPFSPYADQYSLVAMVAMQL